MRILFVYPAFDRHAQSHPELREFVPCREYIGPPSLGIASVAAMTPPEIEFGFIDDRVHPLTEWMPDADLYALSFFTPAATRGLYLGDWLRAQGKKVVMGGIFPTAMPEETAPHCDAVVIGEGELVWPAICADARAGRLRKRYQADGPADLARLPPPRIDLYLESETETHTPDDYPLQISRGCPFSCEACILPTCMGAKIRFFPEKIVWKTLQDFAAHGKRCSLTEDTSFMFVSGARRRFRKLLRELALRRKAAREKGAAEPRLSYIGTSMGLLLNVEPEVLDEVREAGIERFYLVTGFDAISQDAFSRGDPRSLGRAEECIRRCHDAGVEPYTSFLVGSDEDDAGVFDRILEFCRRTKITLAEFAIATPYPGTPMWRRCLEAGRITDRNWRRYNDANVVFKPARLTADQLQRGYLRLWQEHYREKQHLTTAESSQRTVQV